MSITLERPPRSVSEAPLAVHWEPRQAGVWVAYVNEEFAGMLEEHWGRGFTVTTRLGQQLGRFASLARAKAALERHIRSQSSVAQPQPQPVSIGKARAALAV